MILEVDVLRKNVTLDEVLEKRMENGPLKGRGNFFPFMAGG